MYHAVRYIFTKYFEMVRKIEINFIVNIKLIIQWFVDTYINTIYIINLLFYWDDILKENFLKILFNISRKLEN